MADPESTHVHHGFDYVEIPSVDLAASEEFYSAAFGWRFAPYGPGYLGIVTPDGREGGGLSLVGSVERGSLLVVVYSRDIDASLAAVVAAGAEVTRQIFEFPGGRRFHFLDPSGNELGVWALVPGA
jgi:predicted enzyme related to lactoylglutathione lyase